MFRKGFSKHNYYSFYYFLKEMLTGVDQNWPKVPSLSGSFFPNKFSFTKFKFILSQSSRYPDLCSPTNHSRMLQVLVENFRQLVGIGSTSIDRFPTLKYEPSPLTSRVYPRYFTWGATLLPQPWPEHSFIVMRAYRLLSAPAKLSDLTHSYGQNITVLSRQPTNSKVSALAKRVAFLLP